MPNQLKCFNPESITETMSEMRLIILFLACDPFWYMWSYHLLISRSCHAGYEVYLVGGCVRDLILKRTPKDFDIITSAELKEVPNSLVVTAFYSFSNFFS